MPVFSWFKIEKGELVIEMVLKRALVFHNSLCKKVIEAATIDRQNEKACSGCNRSSQSHDGSKDASDSHDVALALMSTSRLVPLQILELAQINGSAAVFANMLHSVDGIQTKLNERNGDKHRSAVMTYQVEVSDQVMGTNAITPLTGRVLQRNVLRWICWPSSPQHCP